MAEGRVSRPNVCARWLENPYYQYFCGEESFQLVLPFDRSSLSLNTHGTPQYMAA